MDMSMKNIYPAAVAALAAASLMSLQSCIGLDGIVEPGAAPIKIPTRMPIFIISRLAGSKTF